MGGKEGRVFGFNFDKGVTEVESEAENGGGFVGKLVLEGFNGLNRRR